MESSVVCPKCQERNIAVYNKCWKCGAPLSTAAGSGAFKTQKENVLQTFLVPCLVILAVSAIALLGGYSYIVSWTNKSLTWPKTEGKVTVSEVKKTPRGAAPYELSLQYQYAVEGKTYHASSISFTGNSESGSKEDLMPVVSRYPKGSMVTVHYDPNAPQMACLETGEVGWPRFILYIAIGLVTIFVFLGLLALLTKNSGRRK
jgi:nitrate reductase NapE component